MNKDLCFKRTEDFVDYLLGIYEEDKDLFITVISKFEKMREFLKEIMKYEDVNFDMLHLACPEVDGYDDEFALSIWMNDGILEVGCEPLKTDGEYTNPCGDITFITEECSSKIIPLCDGSDLYFVSLGEECVCYEECDECYHCDCCCGDEEIANIDKYSYSINGKLVTKAEFDRKHSEAMESFNSWFGRLW